MTNMTLFQCYCVLYEDLKSRIKWRNTNDQVSFFKSGPYFKFSISKQWLNSNNNKWIKQIRRFKKHKPCADKCLQITSRVRRTSVEKGPYLFNLSCKLEQNKFKLTILHCDWSKKEIESEAHLENIHQRRNLKFIWIIRRKNGISTLRCDYHPPSNPVWR